MSERFYFDLARGDEVIRDGLGVDALDVNEAIMLAREVIEEMFEAQELGDKDQDWVIIIRDDHGALLKRLPLRAVS